MPGILLRPTRLLACIYSAVVKGCPFITIRASLGSSKPTETILVAKTASIASLCLKFKPKESNTCVLVSAVLLPVSNFVLMERVGKH